MPPTNFVPLQNPDSEAMRKKQEADDLRKQEKFMKVGAGDADCISCGYHYDPKQGDPEYPVAAGTKFQVRQQPHALMAPH